MDYLELRLFGGFQASYRGKPLIFGTDKARGLLAYLTLNANTPLLRPSLAALFFPDHLDSQARKNLNLTLTRLNQSLEPVQVDLPAPLLVRDYQTVQLNWDNSYCRADVLEFDTLLRRCEQHAHERLDRCEPCIQRLQQAVILYRGDLLRGLLLPGCNEFHEWRLWQMEQRLQRALQALDILANDALKTADYEQAQYYARRQIELVAWQERAHRQLMQALALSGQRAAALAQYESCRQILQAELGSEPETETTALFKQIQADQLQLSAVESALPPHNLPALAASFVGRSYELNRIQTYLQQPNHRLITLVGLGGMGKTWLAVQSAWRVLPIFQGNVYFVSLVDVTPEGGQVEGNAEEIQQQIAMTIARVLRLERAGTDTLNKLGHVLRDKKLLLVLDNFEHLLAGNGAISQLLQAVPALHILVTSRERLNLVGEWVISLEGLDYPSVLPPKPDWGEKPAPTPEAEWQTPAGVERLATFSAVQLLIQRARQSRPAFELDTGNAPGVARLCQLVEGMPLGLELAAGQMEVFSPADIVTGVEANLERLSAELHDLPSRHRNLRVVFEQSWQMLRPVKQKSLAYLSVFRGGFTAVAAQAVANVDWKRLLTLTQKALIRPSTLNGRYELHELLRQFAAAKLNKTTYVLAHNAHCAYYLNLVIQHQAALYGNAPLPAAKTLRPELDNLRQAVHWAIRQRQFSLLDQALEGLVRFYEITGFAREAEQLFARARQEIAAQPLESRLPQRLLLAHANSLMRLGQYDSAVTLIETRLDTFPSELAVYAYGYLGELYLRRGSEGYVQQAQQYSETALKLARATQERRMEALCLCRLDMLANYTTDYQEQALNIIRQLEDRWLVSFILHSLGGAHMYRGNYNKARLYWEEALEYALELENRYSCASLHNNLGDTYRQLGNYRVAERHFEQALKLYRDLGNTRLTVNTLEGVCRLHFHLGNDDRALALGEEGYTLASQRRALNIQISILNCLGHVWAARLEFERAREVYEQAYQLCRLERPDLSAESRAGLAHVCLQEGKLVEAVQHAEAVLELLAEQKPEGATDPGLIYLRTYQAFAATDDKRAITLLEYAHQWLQEQTAQIDDEATCRMFLENVSEHHELSNLIQCHLV